MELSKLDKKIIPEKGYGKDTIAMSKFLELTGKKEFESIWSSSICTDFKEHNLGSKGKQLRCFSKVDDNFSSMESINISNDGMIEGFTKYIVYFNNPKLYRSPVVRFDIGGRIHPKNLSTNKYFSKETETPHIHFITLNNKIIENAISLSQLKLYLNDLIGNYTNAKPEIDINNNSYGMPYLDMKQNPNKYGIKNFEETIKNFIQILDDSIQLHSQIDNFRKILESNNISQQKINDKLKNAKLKLLSNIAEVTLQSNIKNYCNEMIFINNIQKH